MKICEENKLPVIIYGESKFIVISPTSISASITAKNYFSFPFNHLNHHHHRSSNDLVV